jgi:F-type H+-transporting ATPase subunit epsilon
MSKFKLEIISPEKTLYEAEVDEVEIPGFEGNMTILRDHINLVTFVRPGIITVTNNLKTKKFYIENGTIEFENNNLLILSSQVYDLEKTNVSELKKILDEQSDLDSDQNKFTDKEQYINFYKKDTLENIN